MAELRRPKLSLCTLEHLANFARLSLKKNVGEKFGQDLDLKCLLELQQYSKTFTTAEKSADLVDALKTAVETECTEAVD